MDTFEIRSNSHNAAGGDRPIKWKARIILGIVGAIAVIGFLTVLVHSFLQQYELHPTGEHLEAAESDYLSDIRCEEEFCSSKGCIITAARMVDIWNPQANPCEDFYEYACGNYKLGRSPRFQEDSYTPIKEAEDNIIVSLKKILDNPVSESDSDSLKNTKVIFSSCTNTERRNNASLDDFRHLLTEVHLKWPVLESDWQEEGSDWKSVVRKLGSSYRIHTLFHMHDEISEDNPFLNTVVECKIPTLPAAAYVYGNETKMPYITKMYKELIDFVLRKLDVERKERKDFINEIISFETALAESITSSANEAGQPPSKDLVGILEEKADHLDQLMNNIHSKCEGNINKLLDVIESQPDKVIKNYLGWRTVYSVLHLLDTDMKELNDAYKGSFPGSSPVYSSKFRECAAAVRDEMGLMATKIYLDAGDFSQKEESEVRGMMAEMKTAFATLFRTLPWMDNNTMAVFQDKLKRMKLTLGYPEDLRDDHPVDHLFHDLEINENDTYFHNVMKVREHIKVLLDSGYRDHSVDVYPLSARSLYDYINNTVDMKIGLFRSPVTLFGEDYPKYLKYGHAVIMAHEISHGFDALGALFNAIGQKEGIDWWPGIVKSKFLGFIKCLRQQESLRSGTDENEIDIRIINNDIADLGSFFITYEALSLYLRIHGEEERPLPGLSLNKKQTYIVQAAQMFCELREPRPTIDPYIKSSRTGKERVNSVISNFEDFGAIFNCHVGSPMNPAHKCNLLR